MSRTRSASSCIRCLRRRPPTPASFFSERSRIRRTEWRRLSAESGFWKTIWSARSSALRALLIARRERLARRARRLPSVGGTIPSSVRASVVFPLPGLADEPERLAGPDRGADVRERVDLVSALLEDLRELPELDERLRRRDRPRGARGRQPPRGAAPGARSWYQHRLSWPAATTHERRLLRRGSARRRARSGRRTRTPRCSAPRLGRKPGIVSSRPWSLRTPPRGMQRRRPTVYGWRGSCSTVSTGPSSTSRPA